MSVVDNIDLTALFIDKKEEKKTERRILYATTDVLHKQDNLFGLLFVIIVIVIIKNRLRSSYNNLFFIG